MKYVSTRGKAPVLGFDDVLLAGLARDGGLYVPETWPVFSEKEIKQMKALSYQELAVKIMLPFVEEVISEKELKNIVERSYKNFRHTAVAPLKHMEKNIWVMELFHGPTLAFKDYALQFLGNIFEFVLDKRNEHITIAGATSGDTGSAAIQACRDRKHIDIFILHPEGKVSDVQRKQMTTVDSENVYNIAFKGAFDDCQDMVKALFNDEDFRDEMNLSAVNSINWARIMSQIVYYFYAAIRLGSPDTEISFAVPTGNFGNIFAGYCAKQMGLPIKQLIVGSNCNDILPRFFETGSMEKTEVIPTTSPSMDIQISSNFERFLFELYGRNSEKVNSLMEQFAEKGSYSIDADLWKKAESIFDAHRQSDKEVEETIAETFKRTGEILDPHTAIGFSAAVSKNKNPEIPVVSFATAHPAKFPAAVKKAIGKEAPVPEILSAILDKKEMFEVMPDDKETVKGFIRNNVKRNKN